MSATNPAAKSHRAYLLRLIERDLGDARDNLVRSRHAAKSHPPEKEWGQSGETLGSIISGYEDWEAEALAVKEWLEGM